MASEEGHAVKVTCVASQVFAVLPVDGAPLVSPSSLRLAAWSAVYGSWRHRRAMLKKNRDQCVLKHDAPLHCGAAQRLAACCIGTLSNGVAASADGVGGAVCR